MSQTIANNIDVWKQLKNVQERRCAAHTVWANLFNQLLKGKMDGGQFEVAVSQTILNEFKTVSTTVKAVAEESKLADQNVSPMVQEWAKEVQKNEKAKYENTIFKQQLTIHHLTLPAAHNPNCFLINKIDVSNPERAIVIRKDLYWKDEDEGKEAATHQDPTEEKKKSTADKGKGEGEGSSHSCSHDHDLEELERQGNDCAAVEARLKEVHERLQEANRNLTGLMEELQQEISDE